MPIHQDNTLLIFRIDRIACAVSAESVQSIVMPPPQLTQPPGSDKGRPGIFRHAEHIYSVVDLHQRFGIDTPRNRVGRLLLHENGLRRHALWVDEVVGLVRSGEGQWATLPPYLPASLFHSGFLYNKEIVLCSTLDALMAMQDAGPIHRHLESLRHAEKASVKAPTAEKRQTVTPLTKKISPTGDTQKASTTANTRNKAVVPVVPPSPTTKLPASTTPTSQIASHQQRLASTRKTSTTSVTPAKRQTHPPITTTQRPATQLSGSTTGNRPHPTAINTQIQPTSSPGPSPVSTDNEESHGMIWLSLTVLLLGLLGVGGALLLNEPEKTNSTKRYSNRAPPYTAPKREPRKAVVPTQIVSPAPLASASVDNTEPSVVQVGRDEEGTIQLVIQREQLPPIANASQPTNDLGKNNTDNSLRDAKSLNTHTSLDRAVTNEEEPLLPDADWPKPSSLPEPCDCIHIVVKGDTLFAIAQRYTRDAYNYPQLASQSGIHNPHRIYPGDKVHIIIR